MKYLRNSVLFGIAIFWVCLPALPAGAAVSRNAVRLPPPIHYASPPHVIVLPGTYIYVVPDIDEDLYFYDGYWYRPWKSQWYRSRRYDREWVHYSRVPNFYRQVPPGWRQEYRDHKWKGRPWHSESISHQQVQRNWSTWKRNKYWEKHRTWGVDGMPPQHRQPPRAQPQGNQGESPRNQLEGNQGQRPQPQGNQGPKHQDQKSGNRN